MKLFFQIKSPLLIQLQKVSRLYDNPDLVKNSQKGKIGRLAFMYCYNLFKDLFLTEQSSFQRFQEAFFQFSCILSYYRCCRCMKIRMFPFSFIFEMHFWFNICSLDWQYFLCPRTNNDLQLFTTNKAVWQMKIVWYLDRETSFIQNYVG